MVRRERPYARARLQVSDERRVEGRRHEHGVSGFSEAVEEPFKRGGGARGDNDLVVVDRERRRGWTAGAEGPLEVRGHGHAERRHPAHVCHGVGDGEKAHSAL